MRAVTIRGAISFTSEDGVHVEFCNDRRIKITLTDGDLITVDPERRYRLVVVASADAEVKPRSIP